MQTVEELRKNGWKIRVIHARSGQKGGKTVIEARNPIGRETVGVAYCSNKDNYNKKLGVKIALGRALKSGV